MPRTEPAALDRAAVSESAARLEDLRQAVSDHCGETLIIDDDEEEEDHLGNGLFWAHWLGSDRALLAGALCCARRGQQPARGLLWRAGEQPLESATAAGIVSGLRPSRARYPGQSGHACARARAETARHRAR